MNRPKRDFWEEAWLLRRVPAAIAAMLLTGIALATLPGDDGEAQKDDPALVSSAAAPVAPDTHGLELLHAHRHAVHRDRAPYWFVEFRLAPASSVRQPPAGVEP